MKLCGFSINVTNSADKHLTKITIKPDENQLTGTAVITPLMQQVIQLYSKPSTKGIVLFPSRVAIPGIDTELVCIAGTAHGKSLYIVETDSTASASQKRIIELLTKCGAVVIAGNSLRDMRAQIDAQTGIRRKR